MSILVWIVRIIGILLLVAIGLVLLAVLLLLFSPIRYVINADKKAGEEVQVKARLTWAFPIFSIVWEYKEELVTTVRLFGFRIKKRDKQQNDRESEAEEIDSKRQKIKKKKKKPIKEPTKEKGKPEKKADFAQSVEKQSFDNRPEQSLEQKSLEGSGEKSDQGLEQESLEGSGGKSDQGLEQESLEGSGGKLDQDLEQESLEGSERKQDQSLGEKSAAEQEAIKNKEEFADTNARKGQDDGLFQRLRDKIKQCIDFIKDIPVRVQRLKEKFLQTIWKLKEKKAQVLQPITKYMDFWNAIENQAGIMLLKTHGRKLLVHILPKRWKGYIHFGMDNPASTGKVLAGLSILYGLAGTFPRIEPDFEQEVLEGRIQAKGRLYGCVLLVHFVKVWRNKEFHRVKSNFEKLRRK